MGEESFPDVAKMNTRMVNILDKIGINWQTAKKMEIITKLYTQEIEAE
jgi:hypothetical protein